jgi:uncharacterized coiled-coil DUF342 family protein
MPVKVGKNEERAAEDAHKVADRRRQARTEAEDLRQQDEEAGERASAAHQEAERTHREMHEHVRTADHLAEEAYARDEERRRQVDEFDAERAGERSEAGPGDR